MIHIVLVEPEIPQNTGNISRTCAATGCALHLIKPLGFRIDEKAVRRAGLDYWQYLQLTVHEDYEDFLSREQGKGRTPIVRWIIAGRKSFIFYSAKKRAVCRSGF